VSSDEYTSNNNEDSIVSSINQAAHEDSPDDSLDVFDEDFEDDIQMLRDSI
jgi:hypothetical protein